jgi:hypothetical protein
MPAMGPREGGSNGPASGAPDHGRTLDLPLRPSTPQQPAGSGPVPGDRTPPAAAPRPERDTPAPERKDEPSGN